MKRVVRIVTRLNRGGPSRQIEALAPRLGSRGWDGPVLCGRCEPGEGSAKADIERLGVEVIDVPGLSRGLSLAEDARAYRALLSTVRALRPDLIHTHMGKAGALGRIVAHRLRVPVVHTLHGHHFGAPGRRGLAARVAERLLARRTTATVALSPRQAADLIRVLGPLQAGKVTTISPGFDIAAYVHAAEATTVAGPAPGRARVVFAGRLVPVKRVDRLLDAVGLLRGAGRALELHVLGDGPERPALEALARRHHLRGAVRFLGTVDDPAPHLRAADVVALSSASEGVPLTLLEAMALGKPVVAPAVGGIPDVVVDGVHGRLARPTDLASLAAALADVLADPARAAAMGAAARDHVRANFDADPLADKTAALYDRLSVGTADAVSLAP